MDCKYIILYKITFSWKLILSTVNVSCLQIYILKVCTDFTNCYTSINDVGVPLLEQQDWN